MTVQGLRGDPTRADALDLASANARLEHASPEDRLAFAVETFGDDLLFTSSFGAQSGVLLHLWSRVAGHLPVIFIDTGFLFPETLRYRDALAAQLGLEVLVLRPDIPNADFVGRYGADIQRNDPDFCCGVNKVSPLAPLRAKARGWVSGMRRDQSRSRADLPIVVADVTEPDGVDSVKGRSPLVRVHPLATLTKSDVATYLRTHGIAEHPLVRRRYLSIGCEPCTRAVADGEDERAGRWAWSDKTECGLHPTKTRDEAPRT